MIDLRRKRREDLGFARLGNGIAVYDRSKEENGDFKRVAHISEFREIKYYSEPTPAGKAEIENFAATAHPSISVTQENKVFRTEPKTF